MCPLSYTCPTAHVRIGPQFLLLSFLGIIVGGYAMVAKSRKESRVTGSLFSDSVTMSSCCSDREHKLPYSSGVESLRRNAVFDGMPLTLEELTRLVSLMTVDHGGRRWRL